jgi:phosphoglycerate kinase
MGGKARRKTKAKPRNKEDKKAKEDTNEKSETSGKPTPKLNFKTIDDFDFKSKRVLVRVGIDSPFDLEKKQIRDNDRLEAHAKLLSLLSRKRAMVVAIGHQSRPGKPDFTDLSRHAKLLTKHAKKDVTFIPDIIGNKAVEAIKAMKPGDIILLDNVRKLKDEMIERTPTAHTKSRLVRVLQPLFDVYVDNAFSNCHRSHASMVGFTRLKRLAGPVVVDEVLAAEKAKQQAEHPSMFVMGGLKIFDYFDLIEKALAEGTVDRILTTGTLGELCLIAMGSRLGKKEAFLKKKDSLEKKSLLDLVPRVKKLLDKYPMKFEIPGDLAEDIGNGKETERHELSYENLPTDNMIWDIGTDTAKRYSNILKMARTIYLKGCPGDYRVKGFSDGSKIIINAIASATKDGAYTLIGGGSAVAIVDLYSDRKRFSHISLAGGALMDYMAGKKLPGLEVLKQR